MNNKKQAGFGVVIVIVAGLVLAGLGYLGYRLYGHLSKPAATVGKTDNNQAVGIQTDPYAGWNTYEDANLSLKYPTDWIVRSASESAGWVVAITSPDDSNIQINNTDSDGSNASHKRLQFYIRPLMSQTNCREACTTYSVQNLAIKNADNAKLVISDWGSQGSAQVIEVIDDQTAVVGGHKYSLGATINGKLTRIYGFVAYDTQSSNGELKDVSGFEQNKTFQDLVKLVNSIALR